MVENDRIKSESELNEIKMKDLDRIAEITEKECRIERRIAEFWKDFAESMVTLMVTTNGCMFCHVLNETSDLIERDLIRYISKLADEGIADHVSLKFAVFKDNSIDFKQKANSPAVDFTLNHKKVHMIYHYRDINVLK